MSGESASEATSSGVSAEEQDSNAPAVDVLFDGQNMHVLESKRVHTHNTHGTGTSASTDHCQIYLSSICIVISFGISIV